MVLEFEEIRSVVESGGRIKVRRVNGKPYLYLVYPDGRERCAGKTGIPRMLRGGLRALRGLGVVLEFKTSRRLGLRMGGSIKLNSNRSLGLGLRVAGS